MQNIVEKQIVKVYLITTDKQWELGILWLLILRTAYGAKEAKEPQFYQN